jgi:hypothetical protein
MRNNDNDDDDDNFDVDYDINNFNNINESFSYQLIFSPKYAALQSESVLWTAVILLILLSNIAEYLRTDCNILGDN